MSPPYAWRFFRAGGFDQVRVDSGADLAALGQLEPKLWAALSCPVQGLELDAKSLRFIDTDKDGRIRQPELVAACGWAKEKLRDVELLGKPSDRLARADLAEGASALRDALDFVLAQKTRAGEAAGAEVSLADVEEAIARFDKAPINGDGIVPEQGLEDEPGARLWKDVVATKGFVEDRAGRPGIDAERLKAFFGELEAYVAWLARAEADAAVLALGPATAAAWDAVEAVRAKVDEFFVLCELAAYDPRASAAFEPRLDVPPTATPSLEALRSLPLARPEASGALPLRERHNPAFHAAVEALRTKAVEPLFGELPALAKEKWTELSRRLAPFGAWSADGAGFSVKVLGPARARELLASGARAKLEAAFAREKELEVISRGLDELEKLVRLRRDLLRLANNFVAFRDFYVRKERATFEAGTLFLDQRSCDLCVRVDDAAKHALLAPHARLFLAYCDCVRPATGEKLTIAAAFTDGDSDNLLVGRNGVFFDRQGRDWDATIVRVVNNPISLRQAFWSPYKKAVRFIEEQLAKRAAAAETKSEGRLTQAATDVGEAAQTGQEAKQKPKFDVGTVAALGVAVGGLTAAIGSLAAAVFGLGWWMPLGLLGLVLAISGPSMLIAWLKLRRRNLGPLLDANGWAVNSAARLNVPFGASLTQVAALPKGARRELEGPFADTPRRWRRWALLALVLAAALAWLFGGLDRLLPEAARSTKVLQRKPPAPPPSPEPAPPEAK